MRVCVVSDAIKKIDNEYIYLTPKRAFWTGAADLFPPATPELTSSEEYRERLARDLKAEDA